MKAKREVKRMCTGCGEMFDKRMLVRVVKSPEGEISLDLTGKKNGRGAYVCNNPECLKKARKKRAFERAFPMKIEDEIYDKIKEKNKGSEIIFIGTNRGLENDLVPRAGYKLKTIDAYELSKKISIENIKMSNKYLVIFQQS